MIYLHIGLMKSGTTYFQNAFAQQRDKLKAQGVLYPGDLFNQQHACYGLCGTDIPWVAKNFRKWQALGEGMLQELACHNGDVLISSEALASMSEEGVERFCARLGGIDRVLITVRNFPRTLVSAWEQNIKGGGRKSIGKFFERLARDRPNRKGLWCTYSFSDIARIWRRHANVTLLVVAPPSGRKADPTLQRFADLLGCHISQPMDLSARKSNASLGYEDVELIRHVNESTKSWSRSERDVLVRNLLSTWLFNADRTPDKRQIMLPADHSDEVVSWASSEVGNLPAGTMILGNVHELSSLERVEVGNPVPIEASESLLRLASIVTNSRRSHGPD